MVRTTISLLGVFVGIALLFSFATIVDAEWTSYAKTISSEATALMACYTMSISWIIKTVGSLEITV